MKTLAITAANTGLGAQRRETESGPAAIISLLKQAQINIEIDEIYPSLHESARGLDLLPEILKICNSIAWSTFNASKNENFPLILGGDHSIAAGSWSGIIKAHEMECNFGLIWIDAHLDSHTYSSSYSKAFHGMPLAALLGYGKYGLEDIMEYKPKLSPKHVAQIGARNFEKEEHEFLQSLGVKIFYQSDIKRLGLKEVFKQALAIASSDTLGYGISLDLDALDPQDAPGVGSACVDGISYKEFKDCIQDLLIFNKLKGFEIVEYNPVLDINNKTADICVQIIDMLQKFIKASDDQNSQKALLNVELANKGNAANS